MSQEAAAGSNPGPGTSADQPSFQIEKLYVKDLSLEVPNAPQVFMQSDGPQLEIEVRNQAAQFSDGLFDVAVTVTVTARAGEKTIFLAEVAQAGIFVVRGVSQEDLEPLLAVACPTILYPYAREAIDIRRADRRMAVGAAIIPSHVVGDNEDEVGTRRRRETTSYKPQATKKHQTPNSRFKRAHPRAAM